MQSMFFGQNTRDVLCCVDCGVCGDTESKRMRENSGYWYARCWSKIYATLNPRTSYTAHLMRSLVPNGTHLPRSDSWYVCVCSCAWVWESVCEHATLIQTQNIMLIWTLNNKYSIIHKNALKMPRVYFISFSFLDSRTGCSCRRHRFHCHCPRYYCIHFVRLPRRAWSIENENKRHSVEIRWNYSLTQRNTQMTIKIHFSSFVCLPFEVAAIFVLNSTSRYAVYDVYNIH